MARAVLLLEIILVSAPLLFQSVMACLMYLSQFVLARTVIPRGSQRVVQSFALLLAIKT